MPRSRDLLQRFRLAGTPGAPAVGGVPADRLAEISAELEPVLALLADTQQQARSIRTAAQDQARRSRHDAEVRARALVDEAHREAEGIRAEAAARVRREAQDETAAALATAEAEAERVRRTAAERMPGYVDRVVAGVRATVMGTGR